MLLSLLLLVGSQCVFIQVQGVALIEKFDADLKAEFLAAHNDIRGQVSNPKASNMQTMIWNEDLARVAEANVKTCVMKHTSKENRKTSEFDLVGENLYDHWGGNNSLVNIGHRAVKAWYSEISDYHFENRSCTGKMCGHYTQVVWATSYKVGCAIAICDGGEKGELNGILVCCNYGPAGNQVGPDGPHSPYKIGDPCTECYEGQSCNKNLCRTPDGSTPPPELQPTLGVQKLSEDMKDDILKEHNEHRKEVSNPQASDMQMLVWDDELAEIAESNVKDCVLRHTPMEDRRTSEFFPTGENLYTYRGSDKSLDDIADRMVTRWYTEKKDYHYNNRTCNKGRMCSHYTQLIWAKTYKVGCAIAICDGKEGNQMNGILACCSYGPHGNDFDENGFLSPYTDGEPCTGCNEGQQCKDKLCYTPTVSPSASEIPIEVHHEGPTHGSGTTKTPEPAMSSSMSNMAPKTTTPTTKAPTTTTTTTAPTTTTTTTTTKAPTTTTTTAPTTTTTTKAPTTTTTTTKATTTTKPTTIATPKPSEPTKNIKVTATLQGQSSSTSRAVYSATATATKAAEAGPTQSDASIKTPESTKHDNVTKSTPVSTTSGERGVHNIHLFSSAIITCLTGWSLSLFSH